MYEKTNFLYGFWTLQTQKKHNASKKDFKQTPQIDNNNVDISKQIKISSSKILSHVEYYFKNNLKLNNIKIEFASDQLVISCEPNKKFIDYVEKIDKYAFLSVRLQPKKIYVDIKFKELHKFFQTMGDQYNFQDPEEFLNFLKPYTGRFFCNKENVSTRLEANREINSEDYASEENHHESMRFTTSEVE